MTMTENLEPISSNKSFGGWHKRYRHRSRALDCEMEFAIYLPPQAETERVPLLWWLSGLTCTDENFMQKAGAHRVAAELGIAIICPDTSPRGTDLPGEHDSYDFGSGRASTSTRPRSRGRSTIACTTMWRRSCPRWCASTSRSMVVRRSADTPWVVTVR